MLRTFFLSLSKATWAQRLITSGGFAWKAASRFVAGETQSDALRVVKELNEKGVRVSLDHLGENTSLPQDAAQAADDACSALTAINQTGVKANLSVKLSQIGMLLSQDLCRENLQRILKTAADCHNFIRIDMEDSTMVEPTLALYRWARAQGFDNLGVVIQAYLYRSESDIRALLEMNARIRLVKGAYQESAKVAFPKKHDVDANFDRLVTLVLSHQQAADPSFSLIQDGHFPPPLAVATHDLRRIIFAQGLAQSLGLTPAGIEFQMLYGIRRDLQQHLASSGYPMRVYVPYGTRWYPYLMRRLAERPANVWFLLSNYFKG